MTWQEWITEGLAVEAQLEEERRQLDGRHPQRLRLNKRLRLLRVLIRYAQAEK